MMMMMKLRDCTYFNFVSPINMGTAVAQWLRSLVRSQLVSVDFSLAKKKNPSDRTMAQGSTQPLTEMSTRIISKG